VKLVSAVWRLARVAAQAANMATVTTDAASVGQVSWCKSLLVQAGLFEVATLGKLHVGRSPTYVACTLQAGGICGSFAAEHWLCELQVWKLRRMGAADVGQVISGS
jgi:hypothetical protein